MPKGVEHISSPNIRRSLLQCVESLMPKGVEHVCRIFGANRRLGSVESLMPKGVEHVDRRSWNVAVNQC